jgi:mRNA interferase MazF
MRYRWNIFMANLEPVLGSEQGLTRPVMVISDEQLNHKLPVVNVLPITSHKNQRFLYPNEVLIQQGTAGLIRDSIVLCYQIRTLDKQRLQKHLGEVNDGRLQEYVLEALRYQLAL